MKRVLAALFLTFALAAIFTRSDAGLPLRGGSGSGGGSTPLATFLASCATDQWCQPSNASAVASNIFYSTGCQTYGTSSCSVAAPDFNNTTSTNNQGTQGAGSNWTIWNGGAYDTVLNRIIVMAGLHNSYCGNEGYAFDITNLVASRMRTPSDYTVGTQISITSGTYNSTTGAIALTVSTTLGANIATGQGSWGLKNLTGTGAVASLNGDPPYAATNIISNSEIDLQGPTSLGAITITGGTLYSNCSGGIVTTFSNGDFPPIHVYGGSLFLPPTAPRAGSLGSVLYAVNSQINAFELLDLSKGYPWVALPTVVGTPNSGWSTLAGGPLTTPAVAAYDASRQRVYVENVQIGGGPPNIEYLDLASNTLSTAGLTGANAGTVNGWTGLGRTGHSEMWVFGTTNTFQSGLGTGNAFKVAFSDGMQTVFALTNFNSLPSPQNFVGACYSASTDKIFIWNGGNTLDIVNPATGTDALYVTTGTVPSVNDDGFNNGAMTKMICDETDHIIVLWWEGGAAPWILKTSKF